MKKLILFLLWALMPPVFAAGVGGSGSGVGGMPTSPIFRGTVSSTKACASGYARITPNLCLRTGGLPLMTTLVRDACTALTMPASDAKVLIVHIENDVVSGNAVGIRSSNVWGYDDAACTTVRVTVNASAREEVATLTVDLLRVQTHFLLPVTAGLPKLLFADDATNTSAAFYTIVGYID